jgi:two-component system, cell cycle sensor histidine kinase and response regulator CckA
VRVLVVDDNEINRKLLRLMLKGEGHEVAEAGDGVEALERLQPGGFDAVISDILMPRMDGYRFCLEARKTRELSDLPIIIYTSTYTSDSDEQLALSVGADRFLRKPASAEKIAEVLRDVVAARGKELRLAPTAVEIEVLKEYSEGLVRKLEERNLELEESQRQLARTVEGLKTEVEERTRAGDALRKSEKRFRRLFESNTIGIAIADLSGQTLDANDAYLAMLGHTRDELLRGAIPWDKLTPPEHLERDLAAVQELQRTGVAQPWEKELLRNDGTRVPVLIGIAMLEASELACIAYIVDLSEQKRAEGALRNSEQRYRLLFEKNPEPMWVFDAETLSFLAVNGAACRHYGYARGEFLRMTIRDIRPPDEIPALIAHLAGEKEDQDKAGVFKHQKKDGTVIEVEITSDRLLFDGRDAQLVLAIDVTDRRLLETQLRLAQKMEAVGLLAGGVAHDFNNLLTVILGYGSLLASRFAPDAADREEIDEILRASERAAALTRQLLAFSRRQVLEPVVLCVNELIANLEKMLRRLIEENVELVTRLDPVLANVRADPGQLEQVIMNLVVNARDAMPKGGTLTIETANISLDDSYAQRHVAVQAGRYVMVAVSDTGTGMDAETQAHIFEPFFTTKEKGRGTGLGLSTVYGIVKQSGGNIWVYSEPGEGTTFKVYLPRVDATIDSGEQEAFDSPRAAEAETILLVEDDPSIRALARRVLEEHGYRVLDAGSGNDALERHRSEVGVIRLLLTDLVMPGMGGAELASVLQEQRAGMRVLFMSGYTDDGVVRNGLLGSGRAFLQKPFTPSVLMRKVRDVLA